MIFLKKKKKQILQNKKKIYLYIIFRTSAYHSSVLITRTKILVHAHDK